MCALDREQVSVIACFHHTKGQRADINPVGYCEQGLSLLFHHITPCSLALLFPGQRNRNQPERRGLRLEEKRQIAQRVL